MLNIVAVQVGNYCGMGRKYSLALIKGLRRHLKGVECQHWLMTDTCIVPGGVKRIEPEPGLAGWWNKLALFRPGTLPDGRVLYFDLDCVPIGSLDDLAAYRGTFAAMRDPFNKLRINSSVMAWEAGVVDHIWRRWDEAGRPQFDPRGDQNWIEMQVPGCDRWQDMLPGQIVSFKADCKPLGGVPPSARLICFHGKPRPHEAIDNFYLPLKPAEFTAPSQTGDYAYAHD